MMFERVHFANDNLIAVQQESEDIRLKSSQGYLHRRYHPELLLTEIATRSDCA